jgi:hypothetical protein
MQLGLSVFARERSFLNATRRIRPRLQPLLDEFERVNLQPTYNAILVGITDDQGLQFFEEVPNNDGFFQVLAGCSAAASDEELKRQVFEILHRAVESCPLPKEDRRACEELFARHESLIGG